MSNCGFNSIEGLHLRNTLNTIKVPTGQAQEAIDGILIAWPVVGSVTVAVSDCVATLPEKGYVSSFGVKVRNNYVFDLKSKTEVADN